jgi:hypothetical protein
MFHHLLTAPLAEDQAFNTWPLEDPNHPRKAIESEMREGSVLVRMGSEHTTFEQTFERTGTKITLGRENRKTKAQRYQSTCVLQGQPRASMTEKKISRAYSKMALRGKLLPFIFHPKERLLVYSTENGVPTLISLLA